MKRQKTSKKIKLHSPSRLFRVLTVLLVAVTGTYLIGRSLAAPAQIYMSPPQALGPIYPGTVISLNVRVYTTSPVNAAFVNINYNSAGLQVVSIQRGSGFPNQNAATQQGNGTIKMQSTRTNSATGDLHYATIQFRALRTGTFNVSPQTSSSLINYPHNTVAFTVAGGSYAVTNPPAPPPPPPTPPPPPPTPTPPPPTPPRPSTPPTSKMPTPKPTPPPAVQIPSTTSAPSVSNLQIANFTINDIGYRSAVVSWTTNMPADSKVNFGENSNNMPNEVRDSTLTNMHRLTIQGDALRGGNAYAVRITSSDGVAPVTLDATFSTRAIPITVKVTDKDNQPVSGAMVRTSTQEESTGEEGTTQLAVSEGTTTIKIEKDGQTAELTAEVTVPESDDAAQQEFTAVLGDTNTNEETAPDTSRSGPSPWVIFFILFVASAVVVELILFLKHRKKASSPNDYYTPPDPDLMVMPQQPQSTVPGPQVPPPAYSSLPELVRQDMQAHHPKKPTTLEEEPIDMFTPLDKPPIAGQPTPPQVPPPMIPQEPQQPPDDPDSNPQQ